MYLSVDFEIETVREDHTFSGSVFIDSIEGKSELSQSWSSTVQSLRNCKSVTVQLMRLSKLLYSRIGFGRPIPYQPDQPAIVIIDVIDDAGYILVGADGEDFDSKTRFVADWHKYGTKRFRLVSDVEEQRNVLGGLSDPDPLFHLFHPKFLVTSAP